MAIRPGISVSAMRISLRPHAASARSAMAQSGLTAGLRTAFMWAPKLGLAHCLGDGYACGRAHLTETVGERRCDVDRASHLEQALQRSSDGYIVAASPTCRLGRQALNSVVCPPIHKPCLFV